MKRGFTLIELMVVIATIAILASIVTVGYIKYQDKADLENTKSIANIAANAVKSYKNKNFEYPSAAMLSDQSTAGIKPNDNFLKASSVLGIKASAMTAPSASLVPCVGTVCVFGPDNKDKIYYITKTAPVGTEQRYKSINPNGTPGGCDYWFIAAAKPHQDYLIAYYDTETNNWMMDRSSNDVTSNYPNPNGLCPFRGI